MASTAVQRKVPVTAMPYAEARLSLLLNAEHQDQHADRPAQCSPAARRSAPPRVELVWRTVMRGRKPSCMHCRAIE